MKRIMKNLLYAVAAICVIINVMSFGTTIVEAATLDKESAKTLTAGDPNAVVVDENVSVPNVDTYILYKVTASTTGVYDIYTETVDGAGTAAYILDSEDLNTEHYLLKSKKISSGPNCRVRMKLEKGQAVYCAVTISWDSHANKKFNVAVKSVENVYGKDGVLYTKNETQTGGETGYEYEVSGNYLLYPTEVVIESSIDGIPVTRIGYEAFFPCNNITAVTIPGSIKATGQRSFCYSSSLKKVTIQEGVERIGDSFYGTRIESIHIPSTVKNIDSCAFMDNPYMQTVTVSNESKYFKAVDNILYSADGKKLCYVPERKKGTFEIPEGVETIGAFSMYYTRLTEVILPKSAKTIGQNAFRSSGIQKVKLNEGLESIDQYSFVGCEKLTYIEFPSTLKTIGTAAFSGSELMYADIPAGVQEINASAFNMCVKNGIVVRGTGEYPVIASNAIPTDVKIYGESGSTAESYAEANNNTFVTLSDSPATCSHADGFVQYVYDRYPTCTLEGIAKTKCPICGLEGETEQIEKTEHNMKMNLCLDCDYREDTVSDINLNESKTAVLDGYPDHETYVFTAKKAGTYHMKITYNSNLWFYTVAADTEERYITEERGPEADFKLRAGERIMVIGYGYYPDARFTVNITCCHDRYSTKLTKATFTTGGKFVKTCETCGNAEITNIPNVSDIHMSATSCAYDGKTKTPGVVVKDSKGKALTKDRDYTLSYASGRKEIGTYKVTVTLKGNYSGSKTLSFQIVPAKVTGLKQWTSAYSTSRIKMSWAKVMGAEGYALYRSTEKNGTYKLVKTVTTTSCTNEGLKAGNRFYYKVRAYKTVNGKKVYGEYSDAKRMVTKPGAPSVTLTAGSKSAKIAWTKSGGANGYEIYMSTSKNGTYSKIKTANASTYSYTKTGLKSGQKYYIKVRAYKTNVDGSKVYSGWSGLKAVTVK